MMTSADYRITEKLYESGNSLVYRARREVDDRPVVLKMLKEAYPSPRRIAWFKREYEVTRSLDVAGVIDVYGLESDQNRWVIILEDFGGESLARLNRAGKFSLDDFLKLALNVTEVLGQIHQQQIIHKDINPANIVLNPTTKQIKIIDFGISTVLSSENPTFRNPNVLEGTLVYISPEQTGRMNCSIDYRTDFYSLGVTFYELLTGRLPFVSDDALELVHSHLAKPPVPPCEIKPDLPRPISEIIMKLMAKNAEDRYQSAHGLKADLEKCLEYRSNCANSESLSDLAFDLGQQDISDRFQIPKKLYGREPEIETLLTTFERVAAGDSGEIEMMLVSGYAGIGKSVLVQELYKPITRRHGYFVSGKFDQFQRNIPYTALIQAFRSLMRHLLSESKAEVGLWREKLLTSLGPNGSVIIEVIPEVELIIGPQPAAPTLGPAEAQNRFNLVFQNFVKVFTRPEHPLTIFLDDLQWADLASLTLLKRLMTAGDIGHLFVIGAYRDNEVSEAHPLQLTVTEIEQSGTQVNHINLIPLTLPHVTALLADTFHCNTAQVEPLGHLVLDKTGGNPFFLTEFLKSLYTERLLYFVHPEAFAQDHNRQISNVGWRWDLAQIQGKAITVNVVELMADKVKKLPSASQQALQLAACIGNQVDLKTLAIVSEKTPSETAANLGPALVEGLLVPLSDAYKLMTFDVQGLADEVTADYKFAHDRVQQAVYSLIAEDERQVIHWRIGQLLLQSTPPSGREERIFDLVNQLNQGRGLIESRAEQAELVGLNLLAGQKAKASAAYKPAYTYFQTGLDLLKADSWTNNYDLTLALHQEAAEAAYLSGDIERMEQLLELVLQRAKTPLDRIKMYEIRIQAQMGQHNYLGAVQTGLLALELLGVKFPQKPSNLHVLRALLGTKLALVGKRIENLSDLPTMSDPDKLAAIRILASIYPAVYVSTPDLLPLVILRMVNLSIKNGNGSLSAFSYTAYGHILCGVVGDIDSSYQFGKLALNLLERFNAKEFSIGPLLIIGAFITHRKEHLKNTLSPLLEAYQHALETGVLENGGYCLAFYSYHLFFSGQELAWIEQEMAKYVAALRQIKQENSANYIALCRQAVLNLLGEAAAESGYLSGESWDQEKTLPLLREANDGNAIFYMYFYQAKLNYLFGAYPQALENVALAEVYADNAIGAFAVLLLNYYDSLASLAVFADSPQSKQKDLLKKVKANQKKMKQWADHAPMNHRHKYYLVEAEQARVLGQESTARDYYDQAIALAQENEYLNEEALAYELAGEFYLSRRQDRLAEHYLGQAHYAYTRWGAVAKIQDLEARYPQIIEQTEIRKTKSRTATTTTTGQHDSQALDLTSVIKASQAISGEIVLDKLLATLMKIVIESAGAQRGCLILEQEAQVPGEAGQWVIEAEAKTEAGGEIEITALQAIPIQSIQASSTVSPLPTAIINYVARTQENIVLNDAVNEGDFTGDSYVVQCKPQSILCAPLINHGQLLGMLYLENNLTIGAFTANRLEMLQLLSAQAAVSLENARLYTGIVEREQKYRTLFEDSRDAIFITTPAGQIVDVNQATLDLFGYTRTELVQLPVFHLYADPADRARFQQVIEQTGSVRDFEVRLHKKDGTELDCLLSATVRRGEEGDILAYQGIVRDITERKRQEAAERRLEAYRQSPLGRAEALAQTLLSQPETALSNLHALAQTAGHDTNAASLMGHLPTVLESLEAKPTADLAEGFNYFLSSQTASELLPVGLRTLTAQLEQPSARIWPEAAAALAVYQLCQTTLAASSITQITRLLTPLQALRSEGVQGNGVQVTPQPPTSLDRENFATHLTQALAQLSPVAEALYAYERVDTAQDKLAYLASAVERLGQVDRLAQSELSGADRPLIQGIAKSWLGVVTGIMSDLQTQAQISCRLLTRHTWQDEIVTLTLSLRNVGRGVALNLNVTLMPTLEYTVVDETAWVERLAPGEETSVELRVRPQMKPGMEQFRVGFVMTYTDTRGPGQVENFADVVHLLTAAGEFQFIPNPYVVGTPLQTGSPLFVGREDLLTFIEQNLAATHRNNLVLIGQRRTGKTSLLKQLPAQLGEAYLPVYLDGQSLGLDPGMTNFFVNLATEIAFAVEDCGLHLEPPEVDDFADSPASVFERRFLSQARTAIGQRHLLLLLDEFEELETAVQRGNLDASVFSFLRHLIQHTDNLSMIFCGTHRLEELVADYWSVLFNLSLYRHVAYLERPQALRLIQKPVAAYGLRYDDLALNKMWRVTAGHPYFLQLLCHSLVNRHNQSQRNYVTVADVNAALEEIFTAGKAHFIYLWMESSPIEQLSLTALSRMMPLTGQVSPAQVADYLAKRGVNIERQAVSQALHRLALRDILQRSDGLEPALGEVYRWQLGLLGLWVEQNKSLSRVVDEVAA
ncbi:MAG: AAA family ATPase [Anaerolineae bacterium]|nr:AAA family ATPase [Anaerolineae bacterium]